MKLMSWIFSQESKTKIYPHPFVYVLNHRHISTCDWEDLVLQYVIDHVLLWKTISTNEIHRWLNSYRSVFDTSLLINAWLFPRSMYQGTLPMNNRSWMNDSMRVLPLLSTTLPPRYVSKPSFFSNSSFSAFFSFSCSVLVASVVFNWRYEWNHVRNQSKLTPCSSNWNRFTCSLGLLVESVLWNWITWSPRCARRWFKRASCSYWKERETHFRSRLFKINLRLMFFFEWFFVLLLLLVFHRVELERYYP